MFWCGFLCPRDCISPVQFFARLRMWTRHLCVVQIGCCFTEHPDRSLHVCSTACVVSCFFLGLWKVIPISSSHLFVNIGVTTCPEHGMLFLRKPNTSILLIQRDTDGSGAFPLRQTALQRVGAAGCANGIMWCVRTARNSSAPPCEPTPTQISVPRKRTLPSNSRSCRWQLHVWWNVWDLS